MAPPLTEPKVSPLGTGLYAEWRAAPEYLRYQLQFRRTDHPEWASTPGNLTMPAHCVWDGVEPGQEYVFRVRGMTRAGAWGPFSAPSRPFRYTTAPTPAAQPETDDDVEVVGEQDKEEIRARKYRAAEARGDVIDLSDDVPPCGAKRPGPERDESMHTPVKRARGREARSQAPSQAPAEGAAKGAVQTPAAPWVEAAEAKPSGAPTAHPAKPLAAAADPFAPAGWLVSGPARGWQTAKAALAGANLLLSTARFGTMFHNASGPLSQEHALALLQAPGEPKDLGIAATPPPDSLAGPHGIKPVVVGAGMDLEAGKPFLVAFTSPAGPVGERVAYGVARALAAEFSLGVLPHKWQDSAGLGVQVDGHLAMAEGSLRPRAHFALSLQGTVAGTATVDLGAIMVLRSLEVLPGYQGRGYGQRLLVAIERALCAFRGVGPGRAGPGPWGRGPSEPLQLVVNSVFTHAAQQWLWKRGFTEMGPRVQGGSPTFIKVIMLPHSTAAHVHAVRPPPEAERAWAAWRAALAWADWAAQPRWAQTAGGVPHGFANEDEQQKAEDEFGREDGDEVVRCHGTAASHGGRCRLTSLSPYDGAAPLRCGSKYCHFHRNQQRQGLPGKLPRYMGD
mmetsp:Transcript_11847/g.40403  ORF Transcript_11847/g.40403 Transcript_11847/m.40403 type:complete len:619 (+) Transcript_11847:101-1957(+)